MKYIYIIGKSCSGKDTIYRLLQKTYNSYKKDDIKFYVATTTRPKRNNEKEGVDYHFVSEKDFFTDLSLNKYRSYNKYTLSNGDIWYYADSKIDESFNTHCKISTLKGILNEIPFIKKEDEVYIFNISVPNDILVNRVYERESKQSNPNWKEVLRRILVDTEDFSDKQIESVKSSLDNLNINYSFFNINNVLEPHNTVGTIINTLYNCKVINIKMDYCVI